jgi:ubiquinone/menaquinone biosynthesis C-methylase UbiE/heme-degrading monooxygenase HmoA
MILEVAILQVKKGEEQNFEKDFRTASQFIQSIQGYASHSLRKCIEEENKYILLVDWEKLEDHTIGFRNSESYLEWKKLLHHYYNPFPIVEHYEMVLENKKSFESNVKVNKHIQRDGNATKIFDARSLANDYRYLTQILKPGINVLDVGCGTGSISKDIANICGENGKVTGIDNTESFILSGKESYQNVTNLELIHVDLFDFNPEIKFDLIVSARTLQWLSNPKEALIKMKSLLKPNGQISILDYDHTNLIWNPLPPESMQEFYKTFLKWRQDAGMNNKIAEDLTPLFKEVGFHSIEKINSDENYNNQDSDFKSKLGIWSKVAGSLQMVEEGYLDNDLRLKAIEEYNNWIESSALSMTMKLNEVRGKI